MERLRELRKAMGFTQVELAGKVGVSYQQIQKYESRRDKPSLEMKLKIAKALGISIGMVLEEDEVKDIHELMQKETVMVGGKLLDKEGFAKTSTLPPEVSMLIENLLSLTESDRNFTITATNHLIEQLKKR